MLDRESNEKLKQMFGESNSYSDMSDEERNYFVEILKEEINRSSGGKKSLCNEEEIFYADASGEIIKWKKTE